MILNLLRVMNVILELIIEQLEKRQAIKQFKAMQAERPDCEVIPIKRKVVK